MILEQVQLNLQYIVYINIVSLSCLLVFVLTLPACFTSVRLWGNLLKLNPLGLKEHWLKLDVQRLLWPNIRLVLINTIFSAWTEFHQKIDQMSGTLWPHKTRFSPSIHMLIMTDFYTFFLWIHDVLWITLCQSCRSLCLPTYEIFFMWFWLYLLSYKFPVLYETTNVDNCLYSFETS